MTITQRVVRRARNKYGLTVYTHDQWGSKAQQVYALRRRTKPVSRLKADTLVQHITVTLDHGPTTGDFFADVRTVERIGLERFGSGVSYNFVVDMETGAIAVGQPLDAKGTHTVNDKGKPGFSHDQNLVARAIAVLGMPSDRLSDKAANAIAGLIAAMMDEGALTPDPDYLPHSFFAWKDCPSDSTRDRMPEIFKRAKALRAVRKPRPVVTRVSRARQQIAEAVHLLRKVPVGRKVVHREREAIEAALERMPKA